MSGLKDIVVTWNGNLSCLPKSTCSPQSSAEMRSPALLCIHYGRSVLLEVALNDVEPSRAGLSSWSSSACGLWVKLEDGSCGVSLLFQTPFFSSVMSESCDNDQEALERVTSCFQTLVRVTCSFRQLVASLGSSADSGFVRHEMERDGTLARLLCDGLSRRLPRLLGKAAQEERPAVERLWVHFLSALENFLSDLRKADELAGRFPLERLKDRRALINTGCVDGVAGIAGTAASLRATPSSNGLQEVGLQRHLHALEDVLSIMHARVPVALWCVESTQPTCPRTPVGDEDRDSLEEMTAPTDTCCWPACSRLKRASSN
nr:regulator of G-protein signaling 9-binding protein-like [Nerophis lumbriciformis]